MKLRNFFILALALLSGSLNFPAADAASRTQSSRSRATQSRQKMRYSAATGRRSRARRYSTRRRKMLREAPLPGATTKPIAKPGWPETRLLIPEIYVDAPVVRGVDVQALKRGVGYDTLSQLPGKGNCVLAAHRNVWGAEFWHLPRLKPGSTIFLERGQKRYTYRVAFTRTVAPYDTSLLEAPPAHQKTPRLTLYTCTKPKTESRFIVVANQVRVEDLPLLSPQYSSKSQPDKLTATQQPSDTVEVVVTPSAN